MSETKGVSNNKRRKEKNEVAGTGKPKFDKKKWREKKYSQKYRVNEWAKKHEKAVVKQYYKELKKDPLYSKNLLKPKTSSSHETADDSKASTSFQPTLNTKRKKLNSYEAAKAEMQRIKEERETQREERLKKKKEMEAHLAEYKKKRADRYRVLSKKNLKGQPVMKGRLEILYEQIKQSVS